MKTSSNLLLFLVIYPSSFSLLFFYTSNKMFLLPLPPWDPNVTGKKTKKIALLLSTTYCSILNIFWCCSIRNKERKFKHHYYDPFLRSTRVVTKRNTFKDGSNINRLSTLFGTRNHGERKYGRHFESMGKHSRPCFQNGLPIIESFSFGTLFRLFLTRCLPRVISSHGN